MHRSLLALALALRLALALLLGRGCLDVLAARLRVDMAFFRVTLATWACSVADLLQPRIFAIFINRMQITRSLLSFDIAVQNIRDVAAGEYISMQVFLQ